MIATLINNDANQESILVIVIESANLERMKRADPITLETTPLKGLLPVPKYPERFGVMIAYEEDEVELYKHAAAGTILGYIGRGFKFNRDLDGTERAFSMTQGREAEKKP